MLSRYPNSLHPGFVSGRRYSLYPGHNATTTVAAVDKIYMHPFFIGQPVTVVSLAARTGTGGAGSSAKAGIWANSRVSMRPLGAPVAADNTGQATTGSSTDITFSTGSFTLSPGWYWFGSKYTGTLPSMISVVSGFGLFSFWMGGASLSLSSANGITYDDAYANSMPTIAENATFTVGGVNPPIIGINT